MARKALFILRARLKFHAEAKNKNQSISLVALPLRTNGNVCIQQCDIWMARPVHSNAKECHRNTQQTTALTHQRQCLHTQYVYIPMAMPVHTNAFTHQWQCIYIPKPVMPQIYTHTDIHGNTSDADILDTHQWLRYSNVCTATNVHTHRYSRQYLIHRNTSDTPSPQMQQCLQCHRRTHRRMYMATPQTQKYLRHTNDSDAAMPALPQRYTADNCLYTPMAMPWHTIWIPMAMTVCTSAFSYQWQCLYTPMPAGPQKYTQTDKHGNTSDTEILQTHQWLCLYTPMAAVPQKCTVDKAERHMGWLRFVGSLKF